MSVKFYTKDEKNELRDLALNIRQLSVALYPSGEGSGYAGGIMTSAIDGIRSAEHLIEYFAKGDF